MKKNALASLALAFATAFALADNLGTATKVGSLSRSTDYVYTADQADTVIATRVPTTRTVNGHALTGNVTIGASSIPYSNDHSVGEAINLAWSSASSAASTASTAVQSVTIYGTEEELKSGTTATIPLASTSASGVVQLSSATSSTSEALAATPKAVKAALEAANAYADAKAASVAYTHPSYTARTGKPTANASPGFGGTFTVSQITSDGSGHVTGATDRTITIPNAAATTSAAGLMSAADKTALDSLAAGAVTKASIAAALQAQGITSADDMDDMDTLAAKVAAIIAVLEALD